MINGIKHPIKGYFRHKSSLCVRSAVMTAVLLTLFILCSCTDTLRTAETTAPYTEFASDTVTSAVTTQAQTVGICTEHTYGQPVFLSHPTLTTPALYSVTCTNCSYTTEEYDMNDVFSNVAALTDQTGRSGRGSICVIDLDAEDPTSEDAVIWEFAPVRAGGFSLYTRLEHTDDVKFEYCEELDSFVLIFCASSGQCGIAKYPSGECIWQYYTPGSSTHAIELLDGGFVAIANVKDFAPGYENVQGCIKVFDYKTDAASPIATAPLQNAHGLIYDKENDVLWAYGKDKQMLDKGGAALCKMKLQLTDGKYSLDRVHTYYSKKAGEHDITFSPDKKFIWCTNTSYIYRFDIETGKFEDMTELFVKPDGIGEEFNGYKSVFETADGTIVYCCATRKNSPDFTYATTLVSVLKPAEDGYSRSVLEFPEKMIYRAKPIVPTYN